MSGYRIKIHSLFSGIFFFLIFALLVPVSYAEPSTAPEQGFVYEDAQGNPVLTNRPETVPQGQQGKAGATNPKQAGTEGGPLPGLPAVEDLLAKVKGLSANLSLPKVSSPATLLALSGIGGGVMLAIMMLSQNPALKLLMRWLLILLVFGTTAKLYFTQGDLQLKAKDSAEQLQQRQEQKDRQLQQLEPPPPPP